MGVVKVKCPKCGERTLHQVLCGLTDKIMCLICRKIRYYKSRVYKLGSYKRY